MRAIFSVIAIAAGVASAQANETDYACVKGEDKRTIKIIAPGSVGDACDVQYSKDAGGSVTTPYWADNSAEYCARKAGELAARLEAAQYECSTGQLSTPVSKVALDQAAPTQASAPVASDEPLREEPAQITPATSQTPPAAEANDEATPSAPQSDFQVDVDRAPPLDEPNDLVEEDQQAQAATAAEPIALKSEPAPAADINAAPAADESVEQLMEEILNAEATPTPEPPAAVKLEPAPIGKIVGAAPDAAPAPKMAPGKDKKINETANAVPAAKKATPVISTSLTPQAKISGLRNSEDVIRATLDAQSAAWNEGNIKAFMETYWRSDDLKFVSDADITKGWNATMQRYRERYADETGLGYLEFDKVDVEMISDEAAVVTGRFTHTSQESSTKGLFTIVMKRMDGVWRIMHDHTTTDPS